MTNPMIQVRYFAFPISSSSVTPVSQFLLVPEHLSLCSVTTSIFQFPTKRKKRRKKEKNDFKKKRKLTPLGCRRPPRSARLGAFFCAAGEMDGRAGGGGSLQDDLSAVLQGDMFMPRRRRRVSRAEGEYSTRKCGNEKWGSSWYYKESKSCGWFKRRVCKRKA